jgi:hypothetical protein
VEALDRETTDELALESVDGATGGAIAANGTAEGVVDADADVLREEVAESEAAAEGTNVIVIAVLASGASNESVNLDFTSAEELVLGSHDDFLGSGTGERGRCGSHYDCKECKGFVHVYLGLWLY